MLTHHTVRHTIKAADYINVPTYESGCITITDGTERLEIQGLTNEQIHGAISSYIANCGYQLGSEAAETSAWLSELQDTLAKATGRIQRELAEKDPQG